MWLGAQSNRLHGDFQSWYSNAIGFDVSGVQMGKEGRIPVPAKLGDAGPPGSLTPPKTPKIGFTWIHRIS